VTSPTDGLDDDIELSRSWEELNAHAKQRGMRLRRRRKRLRVTSVAAVVITVAGVATLVATHDDTKHNGVQIDNPTPTPAPFDQPVVFNRVYAGGAEGAAIYTIGPDGSGLRRLSTGLKDNDGSPAYAPDGSLIAFQSERDNPLLGIKRVTDIYVMRPDGSGVRRLTTTDQPGKGSGVRHPAWSPDSKHLAAAYEDADDNSRIIVMNRDGSGRHTITDGSGDVGPQWSPDSEWIAFRRREPNAPAEELWVVRSDGTDARRVLQRVHDAPIAWTPDGARLTFGDEAPDGTLQLFTVATDGTGRRQLTHEANPENAEGTWSSDGRFVVYWSDPDGQYTVDFSDPNKAPNGGGRRPGVLTIGTADGQVVRTLTDPPLGAHDYSPSLGPAVAQTS
jgi:hypothetical protein